MRETFPGVAPLDVAAAEEEGDAAETTNHRTDPPRRAASMDAISPMPPGGEMTTISDDEFEGDLWKEEASTENDDDLRVLPVSNSDGLCVVVNPDEARKNNVE